MADPLAITPVAPAVATPHSTRGVASPGDDGCSNFAQALHAARDGHGSTGDAHAAATTNASSTPAAATPATSLTDDSSGSASVVPQTQAAVVQSSATATGGASPEDVASIGDAVPDEAAPLAPASASADPAGLPVQGADRIETRLSASPATAAAKLGGLTSPAADNPVEKTESAKHQQKKHTARAENGDTPGSPSQTSAGTNIIAPAALPSPVQAAAAANGDAANTHGAIRATGNGRPTQAMQIEASGAAPDGEAALPLAVQPLSTHETGSTTPTDVAAPPLQQNAPPLTLTGSSASSPRTALPYAPASSNSKASQSTHAIKDAAPSGGNGATDTPLAVANPTPADKAVALPAVPAASVLSGTAAVTLHPRAETALSAGAQPLTSHPAPHTLQGPVATGSDLQTNGSLLQPSPGEAASRSSALEVGFHDANLGWLSVRATSDVTGGLHAAVGAKTPAALAAVDTMLPALGRFLQQENVAVHSVSSAGGVSAPTASASSSASHFGASPGSSGSSAHQQEAGRDASRRNGGENAAAASAAFSRATIRLPSGSAVAPYSQGERLSTVSVRI